MNWKDLIVPAAPADWDLGERIEWRAGYRAALQPLIDMDTEDELSLLRGALLTWEHGKNTREDDLVVYKAAKILDHIIHGEREVAGVPTRFPSRLREA